MTFSAGRQRRVASPFAQRAAEHAANTVDTPDISTIPDPEEPVEDVTVADAPEILEEHPEVSVESNNQEVANEVEGGAQEPTSELTTDDKPKSGRGRPKSADVQARDERVYDVVASAKVGITRAQLEDELGLAGNDAYMSLFRLRTAGRVERRRDAGAHKWFAVEAQAENA
jgi:hypothetical protein